jgi:hypothetical protein
LEYAAERHVMGDRYESVYAGGKEEPEQSMWERMLYVSSGYA